MIHLTIDGQPVEVPAGTTVLQATQKAGMHIPTLCDHPSLKPYGGCRLCVVEIEGFRTLQASCTLPASNGMVVHTDTPKIRKSRKFVLDLLFSERNHFCMYCQKSGGDCDLQNAAYGEGMTHWPLQPNWKPFLVDASGPYFVIDHNRCILCRRCVRACAELVGNQTLSLENRGASTLLIADYGIPIGESSCVSCGTCVQVCPTGAIIDRQSAYLGSDARAEHVHSVCAGCSLGCGIEMLVHDNQLVRIDGDWQAPVNEGVLCELGRYTSLEDGRERIQQPMLRKDGALTPVSWEEALNAAALHLAPLAGQNGSGVAALASTRLTVEALHAFKQLFAGHLGSSMVTGIEESATASPSQDAPVDGDLGLLKEADCIVAIGVDLVDNHQVAGFFVKRNQPEGARLIVLNPFKNEMAHIADYSLHHRPGTDVELLQGIRSAIANLGLDKNPANGTNPELLNEAVKATGIPAETFVSIGREIAAASKPVIVYGKGVTANDKALEIHAEIKSLAGMAGAALVNPKGKANSLAAVLLGLDRAFAPQGCQAVYLALGDDAPAPHLIERVKDAPFLAVQASYVSPLTEQADVVLPVEMWAEQEGHFLNLEGRLQEARRGLQAPTGVRSNAAVLQDLANCLGAGLQEDWKNELADRLPVLA
jgi:formate dehydrogenase major subunit